VRLAIDTSGVDQALVVLDGRRLLAADDWVRDRADPPVLVRLDAVVKRAGGKPDDIEGVVAARGPGSFTGLRVGLSLAAGLAYARHIPLYAADSLAILARRATGDPASVARRPPGDLGPGAGSPRAGRRRTAAPERGAARLRHLDLRFAKTAAI